MGCCIIGDVHGEYRELLNLVAQTPRNSQLIFVGDLIDRGAQSAHVVRFIRRHNLACVRGNHEVMMIEYGSKFIDDIRHGREVEQDNMWLRNGGIETLLSYGLIYVEKGEIIKHPFITDFIFQFEDDIKWMESLPLYLELDVQHSSGRKVVVSHSAIAPVWSLKDSSDAITIKRMNDIVLWGRIKPIDNAPIFNVFGHTPQKFSVDINNHYVNIDTGCYMKNMKGYGRLSAYCLETERVYSSNNFSYEKVS